jgi:hypothetical protein
MGNAKSGIGAAGRPQYGGLRMINDAAAEWAGTEGRDAGIRAD